MEISLAPWRFRNVHTSDGGPVSRVTARATQSNFAERRYEAFAYLETPGMDQVKNVIYGSADGTGSASSRTLAIYKAISEAIERWAFNSLVTSDDASQYGFDLNPTTSGMAAFPGLFRRSSRRMAFEEAAERWSIGQWWEGRLSASIVPTEFPDLEAIRLNGPWDDLAIVILYGKSPKGAHVYSFACERHCQKAIRKARIEYERNSEVLDQLDSRNLSGVVIQQPFEKRLLYFASADGRSHFDQTLTRSLQLGPSPPCPPLIVDTEIPGPWSCYASIWRCLFERDESEAFSARTDYFLF